MPFVPIVHEQRYPSNNSGMSVSCPGERNVFGASLLTTVQRSGHPLPRSILLCISFLTRTALSTVGIFRRSGVKSRIEKLKEDIELSNSKLAFDSYSPYDIADMLKQYLRELPEPLLTSKLAETFIALYKGIFFIFHLLSNPYFSWSSFPFITWTWVGFCGLRSCEWMTVS